MDWALFKKKTNQFKYRILYLTKKSFYFRYKNLDPKYNIMK